MNQGCRRSDPGDRIWVLLKPTRLQRAQCWIVLQRWLPQAFRRWVAFLGVPRQ